MSYNNIANTIYYVSNMMLKTLNFTMTHVGHEKVMGINRTAVTNSTTAVVGYLEY